jgi:hypothetical protein
VKRRKAPRRRAPKVHQPADRLGENAVTLRRKRLRPLRAKVCSATRNIADQGDDPVMQDDLPSKNRVLKFPSSATKDGDDTSAVEDVTRNSLTTSRPKPND